MWMNTVVAYLFGRAVPNLCADLYVGVGKELSSDVFNARLETYNVEGNDFASTLMFGLSGEA